MKQIVLKELNKNYEGKGYCVSALKNVDLEIEKGEMVAIMGTSGSGKSTLLNILGTIDKPTNGDYYLNGKNLTGYNPKEMAQVRNKTFGFVLQDFVLVERYSVAQNVRLPLYYSNISKREWKQKVMELLTLLGIEDKYSMMPTHISGGQRQRVAIARALINDAEIILADEPTGALDSATAKEIMDIFTKIKEQGKTVIIVTHDKNIAAYCDRVLEISDGVIS